MLEYTEKYNINIEKVSNVKQSDEQIGSETVKDRRHHKKTLMTKVITEKQSVLPLEMLLNSCRPYVNHHKQMKPRITGNVHVSLTR